MYFEKNIDDDAEKIDFQIDILPKIIQLQGL